MCSAIRICNANKSFAYALGLFSPPWKIHVQCFLPVGRSFRPCYFIFLQQSKHETITFEVVVRTHVKMNNIFNRCQILDVPYLFADELYRLPQVSVIPIRLRSCQQNCIDV